MDSIFVFILFRWPFCLLNETIFVTICSFVSRKLFVTIFLKLVFWYFGLLLLLLIVKSDFKHIYCCWVFIIWKVSIHKSVWLPIHQSLVSVFLRVFFEKDFLASLKENLLKFLSFAFLNLLFIWFPFLRSESALCLS